MRKNLLGRLDQINKQLEEKFPLPKPPMSNEDFIPHGIPGRQIVATLDALDIVREMMADDPEAVVALDQQSGYLRNADVPISDRLKASREIMDDIGEAMLDMEPSYGPARGVHPGRKLIPCETMHPEVFKEMHDSIREKRLPRPITTD